MSLILTLLLLTGHAKASVIPLPILYFSAEEAQRQIEGTPNRKPLGGREYRKFYGEVTQDRDELIALSTVQKYVTWPTPVLTRGELFSRGDDNCSVISNFINSVDISVPCQNHDYCYRHLPDDRLYDQVQNFKDCNRKLAEDIKDVCDSQNKICDLGQLYHDFLDRISFLIYRNGQLRQAKMHKELLQTLFRNPHDVQVVNRTRFFSLQRIIQQYAYYCEVIQGKIQRKEFVMPAEKEACF